MPNKRARMCVCTDAPIHKERNTQMCALARYSDVWTLYAETSYDTQHRNNIIMINKNNNISIATTMTTDRMNQRTTEQTNEAINQQLKQSNTRILSHTLINPELFSCFSHLPLWAMCVRAYVCFCLCSGVQNLTSTQWEFSVKFIDRDS